MKTLLYWLLLFAGIVIYLLIRQQTIAQRDRNREAQEFKLKSERLLYHIHHRDSAIQVLFNERREDSVRHIQDNSRLKSKINRLISRISGPAVVQDTIIVFQDSLITSLENERDTLYITDNNAMDSLQRSITDLSGLFGDQLKQNMVLEDQLKREKKKRWSIGPHAGFGLRGPDVGISVQYSLWRF